jgi:uncharacterized protein (TIGR02231 family)
MSRRIARLPLALALAVFPCAASAGVVRITSSIDRVTVFTSAASIHRTARAHVPRGEHQLVFAGLPATLSDESVRVGGFGPGAVAEAVTIRAGTMGEVNEAELTRATEELSALQRRRGALVESMGARPTPDAVRQRDELDASLAALTQRVARLRAAAAVPAKFITVDLTVERDGELDLSVEYLVPGAASWQPSYAAHLTPDGAHVTLDVLAAVQQNTLEDWTDVHMSVSTVMPTTSLTLPHLAERTIELEPVEEIMVARVGRVPMPTAPAMAGIEQSDGAGAGAGVGVGRFVRRETQPVAQRQGVVQANLLSARLEIPTTVTVRAGAPARRVLAARATLDTTLEHLTAPRESNAVFLVARTRNAQQFPLLPGNVALFIGGDYVGTTALAGVPVEEEFSLPFGVDSGVTIDRTLADRRVTRVNGRDEVSLRYDYRLSNHRERAVDVVVLDHLPVSRSQGLTVQTTPTTRAFSPRRDGDAPGVVRWNHHLAPSASERWTLGVVVRSPPRRTVNGDID